MKVVLVDNFDRESVNDVLLKEDLTLDEANQLAEEYNNEHKNDWYYARVKEDNYKLYEFDPNN